MRSIGFLSSIALGCVSLQNAPAQAVSVHKDGAVELRSLGGRTEESRVVLRFGLPAIAAEERWQEKGILRTRWVTDGVQYLQTVLVADGSAVPDTKRPLLLVNIEGKNVVSEYAEAFAELAAETGGKRQVLELKEGCVWCIAGQSRSFLGALEIPASGVKLASGETLKFYGSIPPSLNGSMTLKMVLGPPEPAGPPDWLVDLEFESVLRRVLRAREAQLAATNGVPLSFVEEQPLAKPAP